MIWYKLLALLSLLVCLTSSSYHLVRLIRLGKPIDYSKKAGNEGPAIRYSFTGAMSPAKKESAFMHLPTYTAGVIFHLGTFLSILVFPLVLIEISFFAPLNLFLGGFVLISGVCGIGILIKRIAIPKLRSLSGPDDYISNILVTIFQLFTASVLVVNSGEMLYFLATALLLLYFPLGKLKHAIYFFAARYHLGIFYGWRGVWPMK